MIALCPLPIDKAKMSYLNFLDIRTIGVELPKKELQTLDIGLNAFSRLTLEESKLSSNSIKQKIQAERYDYDIIVVQPVTPSLAAYVAQNHRVDALRIGPEPSLSIFNTRYARRLKETDKLVEVDLSLFFKRNMGKNLRPLLRVLQSFKKVNLSYDLINLSETNSKFRSYRGLQAIAKLLELNPKQTSSQHLLRKIEVNRSKINGRSPFNGVEIDGS